MASASAQTRDISNPNPVGALAAAGPGRRKFVVALLVCVAIAGVLGGATLNREALSHDEIETLAHVSQPFDLYLDELPSRQNGLLFDLAQAVVVRLGGVSEFSLRLLPLLALMGSVALVGVLGARLASRSIGLGAALLLAVHPFAITYGQNARPYAFALFFSVLAVLLLDRALERRSVGRWAAYVAAVALTWYSHDVAILALAAHPVLVYVRNRALLRSYMLVFLGIIAVGVPLLVVGALGVGLEHALKWLPHPWPRKAGQTVYYLGGTWIGLGLCVAILVAGSVRYRALRSEGSAPVGIGIIAFVASWLALPAVLAFVISYWQPILEPRYVLSSTAAACLALSIALATFSRQWRVAGMIVLAMGLLVASVRATIQTPEPDWRAIARYLDSNVAPGEQVVTAGEFWLSTGALTYYSTTLGGERRHLPLGPTAGWVPERVIMDWRPNDGRLAAEARSGRGIWVVVWGVNAAGSPLPLPEQLAGCTVEKELPPTESVYIYYLSACGSGESSELAAFSDGS